MRYRPSAARKMIDMRWVKNRRGQWRHETEEVTEVEYCHRCCREKPGFHKGARIK